MLSLTPALPREAQIEPTGRCNLACRMCTVNDRTDVVEEMSIERYVSLLDQMPQLERLHLQGLGEPMLHPQFFDMVALAVQRGIEVSTNTNLTLLTPRRAQACVDSGLSAISVSLDGATAPVYEAVRQRASFAKVLRNLDRLVAARDAARSRLQVRGVMVLMRGNLDELPALVRLLHLHGVHELLVQRLSNDLAQPELPKHYIPIRQYVEHAELQAPDETRAEQVFDAARALAQGLRFKLHLPRLRPATPAVPSTAATSRDGDKAASADTPRCGWPWEQLYFTAAGELLPCCMVASADRASFGNVFDAGEAAIADTAAAVGAVQAVATADRAHAVASADNSTTDRGAEPDGLLRRWHGPVARAFRSSLASGAPNPVCRSCALYRGAF